MRLEGKLRGVLDSLLIEVPLWVIFFFVTPTSQALCLTCVGLWYALSVPLELAILLVSFQRRRPSVSPAPIAIMDLPPSNSCLSAPEHFAPPLALLMAQRTHVFAVPWLAIDPPLFVGHGLTGFAPSPPTHRLRPPPLSPPFHDLADAYHCSTNVYSVPEPPSTFVSPLRISLSSLLPSPPPFLRPRKRNRPPFHKPCSLLSLKRLCCC